MGRRALRLARLRAQDRLGLPRARAGSGRSTARRTRARWTRRRCCSRSAPSSATPTSRRWSWPASTPTPAATSWWRKVLEILGAEAVHEVHNHHNFAWREEHFGRAYWVVRKGCTPARPGQEGFVGGSMGDESVILEGVESDEATDVAVLDRARRGPGDEPHAGGGPGPASQALGVQRTATATACSNRRRQLAAACRSGRLPGPPRPRA